MKIHRLLPRTILFFLFLTVLFSIPIYWINLDDKVDRRKAFEQHLTDLNIHNHRRISALTPQTCNLIMVDSFCNSGNKPIAVLCSHVNTLYEALHDKRHKESPYFLVLEDDITFLYSVDFEDLISKLPPNFGSVQLMMSHKLDIYAGWDKYLRSHARARPELFSVRERNATNWSAQAILYRKDAIAPFVNAAVKRDRQGKIGFKLLHSVEFDKHSPDHINPFKPVIASRCLHSDTFLYAMAQPSYVLNVPIFNSGALGLSSTLHDEHVPYHTHGFAAIERITARIASKPELRPSFARALPAAAVSGEAGLNWTQVALAHPVAGRGIPKDFNIK